MSVTVTQHQLSGDQTQIIELQPLEYPNGENSRLDIHHRSPTLYGEHQTDGVTSLSATAGKALSNWRTSIIIGNVACVTLVNAMLAGILVVSLPTMARELGLSEELLLWPASVNALACGCTLLVAGSIADVVGGRKIYLLGCFSLTAASIACGVCTSGIQLILFRAAQGVAISLCIPSSVILITSNIPTGSRRNVAFACLGAGNPVGFSVGLVLGGVFVDGIGWRFGYYIGAIIAFAVFIISIYGIPPDRVTDPQSTKLTLQRIKTDVDWIGCLILSTSLGMFSYVLSVLASGVSHFLAPASITLFSIAIVLIPVFALYTRRQEALGRKVIIPSALWQNRVFTSLCITVFLAWGVFNAITFFMTLFFQEVQQLSAIKTSLQFLPMVITGTGVNFLTGWLVKRVRADILVLASAALTTIAPLVMAIINPEWSYWRCAFFAIACAPICADTLFTVANLLITSIFPPETHGLAGGVFNTISNIGNSVGLAITAVVASSVTISERNKGISDRETLMDGYRASFWLCFGTNIFILAVVAFGLRKIGKVGVKVD